MTGDFFIRQSVPKKCPGGLVYFGTGFLNIFFKAIYQSLILLRAVGGNSDQRRESEAVEDLEPGDHPSPIS